MTWTWLTRMKDGSWLSFTALKCICTRRAQTVSDSRSAAASAAASSCRPFAVCARVPGSDAMSRME